MESGRIPNKLKMYRRCQGFSQKKVARLIGLKETSMLSRWEKGIVSPNIRYLLLLSRIYHAQPYELYDSVWEETLVDPNLAKLYDSDADDEIIMDNDPLG